MFVDPEARGGNRTFVASFGVSFVECGGGGFPNGSTSSPQAGFEETMDGERADFPTDSRRQRIGEGELATDYRIATDGERRAFLSEVFVVSFVASFVE